MKTKVFVFLLFVCSSVTSYSQNTTQDEYNFMIKGFQVMLESGLDMKKGYSFRDTSAFTTGSGSYNFIFLNLIREKDKSFAGTAVVVDSKISNKRYYLGLIAANSDDSIDHEKTLNVQMQGYGWDQNIRTAFAQALSEYLCLKMTKAYSSKKR